MLRFSWLLLAAALAFPSLAAYGQEADPTFKCASVVEYLGLIREVQKIPEIKIEQVEGEEAARFMKLFNQSEPPTDYQADLIVFVIGTEQGTITLIKNDRACLLRTPFPAEALRGMVKFLRKSSGEPA